MKLWRRCTLILASLLAVACGAARADAATDPAACAPPAQLPGAAEQATLQRDARDRGMLWRAEKGGRTTWLYGTIHVGRRAWTSPGPVVRRALKQSDVLAVEIDMTDPDTLDRLMAGIARDPRLTMTPELDRRLAVQLARACLPAEVAQQIAPEMLGATLTLAAVRASGLEAPYGLDMTLIRLARQDGKPVHSLETVAVQLAGLLSDNDQDLRESMDTVLGAIEQGQVRPVVERLARVWEQGRDEELGDYADWCDCATTPGEHARLAQLVEGRNPGLADGVDRLHRDGRQAFVAVGSLHLVGPGGLPALLAARGYTVTRQPLAR